MGVNGHPMRHVNIKYHSECNFVAILVISMAINQLDWVPAYSVLQLQILFNKRFEIFSINF